DRVPQAARNLPSAASATASEATEFQAVAGAPPGGSVLAVAVDVVGDLIVDSRVVNLGDRPLDAGPGLAAIHSNGDDAVIDHGHAVTIRGINPHFMVVATGALRHRTRTKGAAAVQGAAERRSEKINFVFVVRRDFLAAVVGGSAAELAVRVDHLPVIAAIIGAPKRAALCGLAVNHGVIAGLDHRVDAPRILGRHAYGDSAYRRVRQPMLFQALPGHAPIAGFEQTAARTAAVAAPGMDFDLPHAGEQNVRIVGIHCHVAAAGFFIHEQGALPGLAAVGGPKDAALRLRAIGMAHSAGDYDIGVVGINNDIGNTARFLEAHPRPCLPCVC